jgi:hypothetical protein
MKTNCGALPGCARTDGVFGFCGERGFTPARLRTRRGAPGGNRFVLRKTEEIQ